jgi:hypothetical protein
MDWPMAGAASGVGVLTILVGVSAYALFSSGPAPVQRQQINIPLNFHSMLGPTIIPIEGTMLEPDAPPDSYLSGPATPAAPARKGPAAPKNAAPEAYAKAPSAPENRKMASLPPPSGRPPDPTQTLGVAKPAASPAAAAAPVRWHVVKTASAGMMNLGGHIDANGNVDSTANSHLRDALVQHANFSKLPPTIQNHIKTQTINLNTIAPYRGLLGMSDARMEAEQGIRFVRG